MDHGRHTAGWLLSFVCCATAAAQSYDDLTTVRGRPQQFGSVLQLRAGILGSVASDPDETIGREDETGWDGHAYFHRDRLGNSSAQIDAYLGRDGAYLGVLEGELLGQETQSRLEVTARYFPFYREGFYRDDQFVPTGRYEGDDYGIALSVAREVSEGMRFEPQVFYRRYDFSTNDQTPVNYVIPDDFNGYGARMYLEQSSMVLNRLTGRPQQGFLLTLVGEREQNDSDRQFGVLGVFETRLPSGFWRGRGHLELYLPQSESMTWEVVGNGQWTDDQDRVYNYDAQKPIGSIWADGELRLRFDLGLSLWAAPFGKLQWVRTLDESGFSNSSDFFYGGGANLGYEIGDNFSLLGEYSYLTNESREPVSTSKDTFGEHRFFAGVEVRFGAQRK